MCFLFLVLLFLLIIPPLSFSTCPPLFLSHTPFICPSFLPVGCLNLQAECGLIQATLTSLFGVPDKDEDRISKRSSTLFVVGTYSVGKERILLALNEATGLRCGASPAHLKRLKLMGPSLFPDTNNPEKKVLDVFTSDLRSVDLHVVSMGTISKGGLMGYLKTLKNHRYTRVVGFRPTGWSGTAPHSESFGRHIIHHVPYSEHSSFSELCEFVKFLRPKKVVPTVYGGKQFRSLVSHFKEYLYT